MKLHKTATVFLPTCTLVLALLAPASARALTGVQVTERMNQCQSFGVDLDAKNECYFTLAAEADDVSICDNIRWSSRAVACRRSILYAHSWSPVSLLAQAPFVLFSLVFAYLLIFKPPRSTTFSAALFGVFFSLVIVYLRQLPHESLQSFQPLLRYLSIPTDGLMSFAPLPILTLPAGAQMALAGLVLYGSVLGMLFRGEKEYRTYAFMLIIGALLLTYWHHPALQFLHHYIDMVLSFTPTHSIV